jgi:hypothetical protein
LTRDEGDAAGDGSTVPLTVRESRVGLARALGQLHAVRRAMLRGVGSADELERAREEYRAAERRLREAGAPPHEATATGGREPSPGVAGLPLEPTRRQEFVRWLYREGRISDLE